MDQRYFGNTFFQSYFQCCLSFIMVKIFLLRGVKEHYNLIFAQLERQNSLDHYTYYEYVSKNHQGGVSDSSEGKVVTIVHSQTGHSHVSILDLYLSKTPPSAKQPSQIFCLQPTGSHPWFFDNHLGLNSVQEMVKNTMKDASIQGKKFTSHSFRATGTTALFYAGVPEALILKCSDHRSTKALGMYERVTPDQLRPGKFYIAHQSFCINK